MKFIMLISIVAVGTVTADAQYFKCQGRVYARQDIARDYLLSKYVETKWLHSSPVPAANIESPVVVNKKVQAYPISPQRGPSRLRMSSIDKANQHHREKPWQGMYLRPLLDFVYSLYEPGYMPNGN